MYPGESARKRESVTDLPTNAYVSVPYAFAASSSSYTVSFVSENLSRSVSIGQCPKLLLFLQVNRWFIQRRKMLRIRGRLYLGRQYEHAIMKGEPIEGEPGDMEDFDDDFDDDDMDDGFDDDDQLKIADERHSLLEKILTGSQQQQQQQPQPAQMARFSGGYVQEIDQR